MAKYKLGWKKDVHDPKDFIHKMKVVPIPERVVLDKFLPEVRNQGSVGSCVGFGIGANLTARAKMRGDFIEWFSPTWIYNGARYIEGTLTEDDGCYPRDALDWLLEQGCLLEHFWPYNPLMLDMKSPPSSLDKEAAKVPLLAYYRVVDSVDGICSAIADGFFVSIGTPWFKKWMNPMPTWRCGWKNVPGVLPEVTASDATVGGHETVLYGYDQKQQVLYGQNSWGCYDDRTEILTGSGWKLFKELIIGDEVATLNPATSFLEYQKAAEGFVYDFDGELYHYKSRDVDLLVTPNHRLYIKPRAKNDKEEKAWMLIEADKIRSPRFKMKKNALWDGMEIKQKLVGHHLIDMDLWLEFLGYFVSEGSTNHCITKRKTHKEKGRVKKYNTCISQNNKDEKIDGCLNKLPWNFKYSYHEWKTNNKDLFFELRPLGKAHEKHLPKYVKRLCSRQLEILFRAMMLGDGSGEPLHKWTYFTSSKALSDDVQEILLKIGWAGDISYTDRRGRNNGTGGITRHIEYRIGVKTAELEQRKGGGFKPERVRYVGKVYCVGVPNHILFVRRNGRAVWSGNSSWGDKGRYIMPFSAIEVFKELGGYDAHYLKKVA